MTATADRDRWLEHIRAERTRQGKPATITDPNALALVAALVAARGGGRRV